MADLINQDDDLVFIDDDLAFNTGKVARAQEIEMRLKTWLGESPYDEDEGVAYIQVFFRKGTSQETREAMLSANVLDGDGVLGVELESVQNTVTQVFTVTGTAETVEGSIDFSVEITPP